MSVRSISVSPAERRRAREFAELLDGSRPATGHELESLVALTATLLPEQFIPGITPRAEFRASLRESLVAQATDRQPATEVARAADRPAARQHRVRTIVVTGVLASLVGGVGAAAASTHALPGDALYGLKRGLESVQLKFATPTCRAVVTCSTRPTTGSRRPRTWLRPRTPARRGPWPRSPRRSPTWRLHRGRARTP